MSPQLQESVRVAADASLCSVNAFIVQILASAVGDPARFRASVSKVADSEVVEIERDARGFPLSPRERSDHLGARTLFISVMETKLGPKEMVALVKRHDAEDPGYFVEWQRLQTAERDAQIRNKK